MRIKEKIKKAAFLLVRNPRRFFKILNARIRPIPKSPLKQRINEILFEFDFDYDSEIKAMYDGVYEMDTVDAMRRFLKKGDTFVDVGASIGYLSAIATGFVGKVGQVHSFEPVPEYFHRLKDMAVKNRGYEIVPNQCALGEEKGTTRIAVTNLSNIGWNTIVPRFMSNETVKETIEVPVHRLDSYIKEKAVDKISLIKIDTEGFEFPVLKGLSGYFKNTNHRPAIICEIAPAAYPLLGCSLAHLSEYMKRYNYHAFNIVDTHAEVDITKLEKTTNVIFISKYERKNNSSRIQRGG